MLISPADVPFRLDGRVALVTGGTRGIGAAIAQEMAAAGARVILTGRNQDAARDGAAALGDAALGLAYDGAEPDGPAKLAEEIVRQVGKLDILVNNAAVMKPHYISRLNVEEVETLFAVNVKAPLFLSKALHPLLVASDAAAVVNITAAGGHRPMAGIGAYCSTKAAWINLTVTLAKEWAADGIRVNGLTPGSVATEQILPKDPARRAAFITEMAEQNLLKRLADPSEIARTARFLASSAASYITGAVLVADGGLLA
jgi:NAD(P)-dependent dehydrogenase (short-subunit alcohol dehydrogenase family)